MNKIEQESWNTAWEDAPFKEHHAAEDFLAINRKFDRLAKKYLTPDKSVSILEIGCSRGKKLIYFGKHYGYSVYGVDYSESGVKLTKENLRKAKITGTILCEDIFKTSLKDESFDIVYSMGLIEHFDDPRPMIKQHLKLLKSGGILIMTIPNLKNSLYSGIRKILGEEQRLIDTHNLALMDVHVMHNLLKTTGVEILELRYFGPIDLTLAFESYKTKTSAFFLHLISQLLGYLTFFLPESKVFSPYIILVARKS